MDRLLLLSDELAGAVQQAARAVVAVHGRPRVPSTGIHWRSGLIVTASHTVQTDDDLTVTSPSGQSVPAAVVGRDAALDVAVLRIGACDAEVADVGESDVVRVGHMVLAVATGPRASWGVISAIGAARSRRAESDVFSLDLTLYPGFSGGPLVDARGAVVGLNTSGASRHLQLAIPAKAVGRVVDAVVRHGRIPRAYLGVSTQPIRVPEGFREEHGQSQRTALIVVEVQAGSPAAAGLLVGDVILSLDGTAVTDPLDLRAALPSERIGQRVRASVIRAGRALDVDLTIGERPARAR
ncbi:MAG: LuxR family transcriptional regulator [Candidatus Rokuibacteriota bacterium]|nr:MAG: LuxR family transcriptional regulator [Candidatus Rokubacteria bacterium]